MTTATTIVEQALRRLGVLGGGETADPNDSADCLIALNELLGQWSMTRSMAPAKITETKTLVASTGVYTLGPTGTLTFTYRPIKIHTAYVRRDSLDYEVREWTQAEYNATIAKTTEGTPRHFLYVPSVLLGSLSLYPEPDYAYTLTLTYDAALTSWATLVTDIDLAPGVQSALAISLAEYISEQFSVKLTPGLVGQAANARRMMKRMNMRVPQLTLEERHRHHIEADA